MAGLNLLTGASNIVCDDHHYCGFWNCIVFGGTVDLQPHDVAVVIMGVAFAALAVSQDFSL